MRPPFGLSCARRPSRHFVVRCRPPSSFVPCRHYVRIAPPPHHPPHQPHPSPTNNTKVKNSEIKFCGISRPGAAYEYVQTIGNVSSFAHADICVASPCLGQSAAPMRFWGLAARVRGATSCLEHVAQDCCDLCRRSIILVRVLVRSL